MRRCVVVSFIVLGCAVAPSDSDFASGSGGTTDGATTSHPSDPDTTTGSDAQRPDGTDRPDETSGGGSLKLDVTPPDTPVAASGCTKVDFLFVIDSSASMRHHQDNLAASFAGFIAAIGDALQDADDFQILVADTDPNHVAICEQYCGFGSPICSGYTCGDAALHWDACDEQHGSGVRHPLGWNASNIDCGFVGADRFLTSAQPDLSDTFSCAARVGTSTNVEWQLASMAAALAPEANGPDGCNAGFVRDDALLVITIITDEPDTYSKQTPIAWHDAVVAAKGGDSDAIVMLGILPPDVDDPAAQCQLDEPDYPKAAPDLHEFVELFERRTTGDVCADNYAPFLTEAVALIDVACDEFVPVG